MIIYIVCIVIALIVAYFCGSIPVGLIVGKYSGGTDLRQHGSGNTGTTNAIRTMGWVPGLIVFVGDALKGALAVFIMCYALTLGSLFITGIGSPNDTNTFIYALAASPYVLMLGANIQFAVPLALAVVAAIAGHMFSPFMHFKGGKGIATMLGALLVLLPLAALCAFGVFIVVVLIGRIVSIGSITAVVSVPVFTVVFYGQSLTYIVFMILLAVVVIAAHRKNIVRISKGEEPRFSVRKKGSAK